MKFTFPFFRLGVSDGASPSLSGSIGLFDPKHPLMSFLLFLPCHKSTPLPTGTDPEPILDPQAIYMIPQEWGRGEVAGSFLQHFQVSWLKIKILVLQEWRGGEVAPPLPAKQPVFEPMMINTKSSLV